MGPSVAIIRGSEDLARIARPLAVDVHGRKLVALSTFSIALRPDRPNDPNADLVVRVSWRSRHPSDL